MNVERAQSIGEAVFQEIGVVREATGGTAVIVETAAGRFDAERAASCLLAPEVDDEVIVAVPRHGPLYVLAVLRRAGAGARRLELDGDTALTCRGALTLSASGPLEARSGSEVALIAQTVSTTAVETRLSTDRLDVVGRVLSAHADVVKSVLGTLDSVAERISQRAKSAYRFIEEIDMTRAKEVDCRASQTLSLRGQNAVLSADDLVKMHGDQIHLG